MKGPMYWSVRRELWENRSIYAAPFVVAILALFGFFLHVGKFAEGIRLGASATPGRQMLGAVDRSHAARCIEAAAARDGAALIGAVDGLRELGLSAAGALEAGRQRHERDLTPRRRRCG